MSTKTQMGLVFLFLVFCGYLLYPTIRWYFFTDSSTQRILSLSNDNLRSEVQEEIFKALSQIKSLPESEDLIPSDTYFLIPYAKISLIDKKMPLPSQWRKMDIQRAFSTDQDLDNLKFDLYQDYLKEKRIKSHILNLGLDLAGGISATLSLDFTKAEESKERNLTDAEKDEILLQTMDGLRERIDQYGLTDPQITREPSSYRIFVDIPGDPDLSRIEAFLRGSNSLSFNIVLEEPSQRAQIYFRDNPFATSLPEGFLGENQGLFVQYSKDRYGFDDPSTAVYYILSTKEDESFDGAFVSDARVGQNGMNYKPQVEFSLTPEGAEKFFVLTSNNIGRAMAVVFEGNIRSVASINSGIPGGRVSISSDRFSMNEANELTTVLRSAAFPVDITIDDWRIIGPSLGADNIEAGVKALVLGVLAIIIFMIAYYRSAGFISVIALLINFFILLAILSTFGLTLTLTSLAGLILTLGMAIDANVIIFERIKEEYLSHRDMRSAVKLGFDRALWTVLDSNITTLIVALFLSALGTGPVQGFAWTLAWGIFTSLFTAVFITKLLLEVWLDVFKDKITLSWRD